jgi:hypothetical protein
MMKKITRESYELAGVEVTLMTGEDGALTVYACVRSFEEDGPAKETLSQLAEVRDSIDKVLVAIGDRW